MLVIYEINIYKILLTGMVGDSMLISWSFPLPFSCNTSCIESSVGGGAERYSTRGRYSVELWSNFKAWRNENKDKCYFDLMFGMNIMSSFNEL